MNEKREEALAAAIEIFTRLAEAARRAISPDKPLDRTVAVLDALEADGFINRDIMAIRDAIFIAAAHSQLSLVEDKKQKKQDARVYFMQRDDGLIKIGISHNVPARRRQLSGPAGSALSILGTMPGGVSAETALHKRFGAFRETGEWFRPAPELLDFIKSQRARPNSRPAHH